MQFGGKRHENPSQLIVGYGEYHNRVKKSIFWDLPYWKDKLLCHSLNVMHIEKNVFHNIMHTILNVLERTKDNLKSRKDLPAICRRKDLELLPYGKISIPSFRPSKEYKGIFLNWWKDKIKISDGYVSKISRLSTLIMSSLLG